MLSNFLKDRIQSLYLIKYALQAIKKSDIILSQLKATFGSIPFFNGDIPAELKSRPEIKGSTSDIVMTVMKKLSNDLNIPLERLSDEFYRKSLRDVADNMTGRESVSL
ncbi:MAG: hypothetical protein DDT19_01030 [Syntrophomonadaceae bacterium]|nr:hypothetical protein [Bacillota bacterium]